MTTPPQSRMETPFQVLFTTIVLGDWRQLDGEQIDNLIQQIRFVKAHYVEAVLERNTPTPPLEALDAILVGLYITRDVLGGQDLQRRTAFYEACAKVQGMLLREWSCLATNDPLVEQGESLSLESMTEAGIPSTHLVDAAAPIRQPRNAVSGYILTDEIAERIRRFACETPLGKWGATRMLAEQLGVPPKIALQWAAQLGCRQPIRRRRRTTQRAGETLGQERDDVQQEDASTHAQETKEKQHPGSRSPPLSDEGSMVKPARHASGHRAALLSAEEERRLAVLVTAGGETAQKACERFVVANQGLVWNIARKYTLAGSVTLSLEDLVQEGNIGLLRAIPTFDPDRGRFSTHATWWIKQAIRRACEEKSRTIRLPSHIHQRLFRVRRVRERLTVELGQEPTSEQITSETQVSVAQLAMLQQLPLSSSLEQQLCTNEDDDRCMGELLADMSVPSPEEAVVESVFAEEVQRVLVEVLSARELRVIELRFGMGLDEEQTLAQAGRELAVSRERARQIAERAIEKLRASPHVSALWK
ncbi:hypothetical protein KSF_106720 [Reticulibacter mediterranei]|uniref:RNA polymerase sigma-70 domain-containing protein n=1 Tax=Reticulibacter mediterranei TaxID=2778369 RepID=A0A8J3IZ60_9CHLR|nr:RNA polymerase sigma factor RpoD/SigA [Reticulibacter mediterranei]GHP00625.1 hypothetical protein KSF_106720 [Reticulibacter mediterranei]